MFIYNVTVKIDLDVHDKWLDWMLSVHIPDVMKTGYFIDNQIFRILQSDESEGISYAIQYTARNFGDYNEYQNSEAARLQKEHSEKFEGKFIAYRTLMRPLAHSE
ncbi:MAG: DUF4286 family protein [Chitinophagales bacterium]|nr:DUF4286 family protein [Chitinophagales bacterium]